MRRNQAHCKIPRGISGRSLRAVVPKSLRKAQKMVWAHSHLGLTPAFRAAPLTSAVKIWEG